LPECRKNREAETEVTHILHFCRCCAIEAVVQNERMLPSQLASLNGNDYYI
jgi:hypothetical protein